MVVAARGGQPAWLRRRWQLGKNAALAAATAPWQHWQQRGIISGSTAAGSAAAAQHPCQQQLTRSDSGKNDDKNKGIGGGCDSLAATEVEAWWRRRLTW